MNKKEKGTYGYRDYRKKVQTAIVLLAVLAILIQLGARGFTEKTEVKNILTVMAVLTVLPMANVASPLIASWRYHSLDQGLYTLLSRFEDRCLMVYELVVTSKEQIIPVEAAAVHASGIILYSASKRLDLKKAEAYLQQELRLEKFKMEVKIIQEEAVFLRRLESLKAAEGFSEDVELIAAAKLLKRLSM